MRTDQIFLRRLRPSLSLAVTLAFVLFCGAVRTEADPIAHWTFDEVDGTTVPDVSGNGNDGTLLGNAAIVDDPERGRVLSLTGTGGKVDLGNPASLNVVGEFTAAAWVKPASLPQAQANAGILQRGHGGSPGREFVLRVGIDGAAYQFGTWSPNMHTTFTAPSEDVDTWVHLAGTMTDMGGGNFTYRLYHNGQEVDMLENGPGMFSDFQVGWAIGARGGLGDTVFERVFDGLIDDVRMYDRPLTAGEIEALFIGDPTENPPQITDIVPAPGTLFHPASAGLQFAVRTHESNAIDPGAEPGGIELTLNGMEIPLAELNVTGSANSWNVAFDGLEPNAFYTAVVAARDTDGRASTRTWSFDTIAETEVLIIEAEDYNYAADGACDFASGAPSGETGPGGFFIDDPIPSRFLDSNYINREDGAGNPTGYVDRVGSRGIDFFDNSTTTGIVGSNDYRFCDPVGTRATTDVQRQKHANAPGGPIPDYHVHSVMTGDWMNYTRTIQEGNYHVFLRASATGNVTMSLDRVTSDPSASDQTTAAVGTFNVMPGPFRYTQLTDLSGNPQIVTVQSSGAHTLRLTAINANNNIDINYLMLVEADVTSLPPAVLAVAPPDQSINVAPDAAVEAQLQHGSSPLNPDSIQLFLNDVNVTASADLAASDVGMTISYAPGDLPRLGNTARVEFDDQAETGPYSFEWSFSVRPDLGTGARLIAFWDFDDASAPDQTVDRINDVVGEVLGGAAFTAPGEGHRGWPEDRAMDFGATAGGQRVSVTDIAPWLSAAAMDDRMTVSFWQKWNVPIANSSAFWMISPSTGSNNRAFSAHAPWGNGNIMFDTAGCCGANQRIQPTAAEIAAVFDPDPFVWQEWHHFAFVKNEGMKEIWIDGRLLASGFEAFPLPADITQLLIGAEPPSGNSTRALIDDFAIFASALTQEQIQALAQGASPVDFQMPQAPTAFVADRSPAPGATGVAQGTPIEVSIANGSTDVVVSSIRLFFDGTEVTSQAATTGTAEGAEVIYTPTLGSLSTHTVRVEFSDNATPANNVFSEWSFTAAFVVPPDPNLLPVANPSFEEPALAATDGEVFSTADIGPGWTREVITEGLEGQNYGVQNPATGFFGSANPLPAPFSGNQIGFLNLGSGVGNTIQLVSDVVTTLQADDVLTLTVAVGTRFTSSWNVRYEIGLRDADGVELGTFPAETITGPENRIVDLQYVLDAADAPGSVGKALHVVIRCINQDAGFGQGNFDNVRLRSAPPGANIAWVSFHGESGPSTAAVNAGFTQAPDIGYTDLLEANGHTVTRFETVNNISSEDADHLSTFDLVIISRSVNSGHYGDGAEAADERAAWHGITAPMINMAGYTLRANRLGFVTASTGPVDTSATVSLAVHSPAHPIFEGISLDSENNMVNAYANIAMFGDTAQRGISISTDPLAGVGTVLASISPAGGGPVGGTVIAEWPAGAALFHGEVLGGHRLVFLSGSREVSGVSSETAGIFDLEPDGAQMFLNAVAYMSGFATPLQLVVLDTSLVGTTFSASVQSQTGFTYRLEFKNALSDAEWTALPGVAGTGEVLVLTDTDATGAMRFYRVVATPAE